MAAALTRQLNGEDFQAERLPLDTIGFDDEGKTLRFALGGKRWECPLDTYY